MGATPTPLTVTVSVPDHRDQPDEIERYRLCRELAHRIEVIVGDPAYGDIGVTFDSGGLLGSVGYHRQCDIVLPHGAFCTLISGHEAPCTGKELGDPIEQCYACWSAPRYPEDAQAQRHALLHRAHVTAQRRRAAQ